MKKKLFFKFFLFAVLATFVTFTACKNYDDDIDALNDKIANLTGTFPTNAQLETVKTELVSAMDTKITAVNGEITALKARLAALEDNGALATKAELAAVKQDILEKTVSLEVFNAFKTDAETTLADLVTELGKKTTQEDFDAFKVEANGKLLALQGSLSALDVRVEALEAALPLLKQELMDSLGVAVVELEGKIATLKAELSPRIGVLEAILKVKDGESEVIADIFTKLSEQLAKIEANEQSIIDLQKDLKAKYDELVLVDEDLQEQITENKEAIDNYINDVLEPRLNDIEGDIEVLQGRLTTAEANIGINTSHILTLSRQLKGLTFIPTRGLPSEKTMKLYYFAGDYTANHTAMYRVSPSNAMLGRDFTIESLNYQITTRSASDGVNDASEEVSVALNGEVTQTGDIIYVPVHIQGPKPCTVFGNIDWWGNNYFFGDNVLSPNNFPSHVVKTIPEPRRVNYEATGGNQGLSLVLTALTNSIEDGKKAEEVYVKSSEMVNTELIPTQIKLAESLGKGNQILDENLRKRELKTTLPAAAAWANENENSLPPNNKNWNALTWSGNQGQGGVWTPGEIDLNNYVSSFFYPQDGGDMTRSSVVTGDPHRYLYAQFGKEFGKPYTDKPNYEKPVYTFEQMIYKDNNHNIVIGPKGGTGVTHSYAELDGSILTVFDDATSIQGIRNKKIIIKVTQINSDCVERQPVGYLVLKYTDDPIGIWPDANHTVDLTNFPYYHKACEDSTLVGQTIPKTYTDGDAGATFTHRNALLELFTAPKFMSPINAPNSYGLSGKINPGDVNVILGTNLQLNGIGEHNMGNIYNIQRRDASVVPNSVKFKAATYNHINDPENVVSTGVSAMDAFRHVMIRYEYANHSYIIYVDDHTPAGDYEITYKLENKENNTQHGNVLYLTFKFKVALREITVEHDKNTVNWQDDNKTIRVQHTRINNSIEGHSMFLSDKGYRVDLKQAFVLKSGTVDISTKTLPAIGGVNAGSAPGYLPKFEFIQDAKIKAAGFAYKRDADNYLTRITLNNVLAAEIENDPADHFNYLYIPFSKEGDMFYNYLMQDMLSNNDLANHNVWTKWGKTELMLKDDMERLLPVRMVTDINADCAGEDYLFPNGNYYYIDDFNIKFERALRWVFTTVELTDNQQVQAFAFDFHTKVVDPLDESKSVYRGLFDHAYDASHGFGNVVHPGWTGFSTIPYTFTNPAAQAQFYGLPRPDGRPIMLRDVNNWHNINILDVLGTPGVSLSGNYRGLDFTKVEISTDGGNTWKLADQDYFVLAHNRRYFNVVNATVAGKEVPTVIWQGGTTAITSPIYFRVPVVNQTAINNGLAPEVPGNKYWMSFRAGYAKVKGYAVFKINPRQ